MNTDEIQIYRDGKRADHLKVASVHCYMATVDGKLLVDGLQRINLATCPGAYCSCSGCRRNREEAKMAAKAPLGQRVAQGPSYVAVIFAGHKAIKVLGLFHSGMQAVAYVKANFKCEPLGKTRFVTKDGEVLIIQEHVRMLNLEEAP